MMRIEPGKICTVLHWTGEWKQKPGLPKNTRHRTVEGELKNLRHTWGTIQKLAQNRQGWGTIVAALQPAGETGMSEWVTMETEWN